MILFPFTLGAHTVKLLVRGSDFSIDAGELCFLVTHILLSLQDLVVLVVNIPSDSVDLDNNLLVLSAHFLAFRSESCTLLPSLAYIRCQTFKMVHKVNALSIFRLFSDSQVLDFSCSSLTGLLMPFHFKLVITLLV